MGWLAVHAENYLAGGRQCEPRSGSAGTTALAADPGAPLAALVRQLLDERVLVASVERP